MNEKPSSKPEENPSDERNSEPAKPMKVDQPAPPNTKENNPSDEDNAEPSEQQSQAGYYPYFIGGRLERSEQQSQAMAKDEPDMPQPNSGSSDDFDDDEETEDVPISGNANSVFWQFGQALSNLEKLNVAINTEQTDVLITLATRLIDFATKQDPKAFERVTAALIAKPE